ncbi:polysaccharide deacetylase family protein [Lacimicrobium sp. SS2-24]|uniref:polysaccharide deacetylase family protein n=1 Tax=Lacimicrobium sp. SS2-24 TaxID=2005569 RepID=UPI000B4AD316|nr:polysaccharide deacetylase family protein [Lacimicrobium sp. SS2-24]
MKALILRLSKVLGLFYLARKLTANKTRVLCYHGISVEDEHLFRPGLFMQKSTFARRMQLLKEWNFTSISLDDYIDQREQGVVKKNAMVITIDDGWQAILEGMWPQIRACQFQATLYLSSYFIQHRRPVFKVAVFYLFWKHDGLFKPAQDSCLVEYRGKELNAEMLLEVVKQLGSDYERPILLELCAYFGESSDAWQQKGKFMFLSPEQVAELHNQGLAIELHTHKHRFSEVGAEEARQELQRNQKAIVEMTGKRPEHFCYPRGEFREEQLAILNDLGIRSATTTDNELCSDTHHIHKLPRIMDNDSISELEFEAEVSGFMTLLRGLGR